MLGETLENTSSAERVAFAASSNTTWGVLALEDGSGSGGRIASSLTWGGSAPTNAGGGNGDLADGRNVQTIPATTNKSAHKTSQASPPERTSPGALGLVTRTTAFMRDSS